MLWLISIVLLGGDVTVVEGQRASSSFVVVEGHRGSSSKPIRHILFFTQKSCPPCRQEENIEFPKLRQSRWFVDKLGNTATLSIIDIDEFPGAAEKYGIEQTPTHILYESERKLDTRIGYQTAENLKAWYESKEESNTKQSRKSYPLRGGNWTGPDGKHQLWSREQAINHLLNDGEHRGKFTQFQLNQMTLLELRALHSDDHEQRVHWDILRTDD